MNRNVERKTRSDYPPPRVEIVEFRAEAGFAASGSGEHEGFTSDDDDPWGSEHEGFTSDDSW